MAIGIGTPPGKFGWNDLEKVLKGAAIAGIGAAAAIVATWTTSEDFDWHAAGIAGMTAFFAVLANTFRKVTTDTRKG